MGKAGMTSHVLFWKVRRRDHYLLQYESQEKQICGVQLWTMWVPGACGTLMQMCNGTWPWSGADDIGLDEISDFKVQIGAGAMKMNKDQSEAEYKTNRLLNIEPWRAATVKESLEKEKLMNELPEMRLSES